MPRVGNTGMEMVAINDYGDIAYGNCRQIAEYIGSSPSTVQNAFKTGRKVKGYEIHRRWRWKYSLIERSTGKVVCISETVTGIANYLNDYVYYVNYVIAFGEDPKYILKKEQEILWDINQNRMH